MTHMIWAYDMLYIICGIYYMLRVRVRNMFQFLIPNLWQVMTKCTSRTFGVSSVRWIDADFVPSTRRLQSFIGLFGQLQSALFQQTVNTSFYMSSLFCKTINCLSTRYSNRDDIDLSYENYNYLSFGPSYDMDHVI